MSRLPDQLLNKFRQFSSVALCKFGLFKLVSKVSRKLFELSRLETWSDYRG